MSRWIFICVLVLLVAAPVACSPSPQPQSRPAATSSPGPRASSSAVPKAAPSPAPAAKLQYQVNASGRLSSADDRKLAFGITGTVAQVSVAELDKVKRGQLLARLDTTSLEQAIKTAEFGVKTADLALGWAQSDLKQAQYAVTSAEGDIKTMQANVKSAAIDLDQAQDNVRKITYPYSYSTFKFDVPQALAYYSEAKRQVDDAGRGLQAGLSADQYANAMNQLKLALDNMAKGSELLARGQGTDIFSNPNYNVKDFWTLRAAQLAADKAQLTLENAQNVADKTALALDTSKNAVTKAQLAVDKAKNDLDSARNNVDKAKEDLKKATIYAPFDGTIADVAIKELDLLTSTSFAALEIINPTRMELVVKVNELDIPKIKMGQKVGINVDALPEQPFDASVTSISLVPAMDGTVVSYEVKIIFTVPENSPLKSGMAATADFKS